MQIKEIPKISVLVITYNQANLIGRAIDSILIQKEFVYEIVICDDCSTDSTWDVILKFAKKYPKLIKPYRNDKNLGIFENIELSWTKPTGDAVIELAGDDTLCNGLFAEALKLIEINEINFKNESYCLFFDYKTIYPSKIKNIINILIGGTPNNKIINKRFNPISLKIRGLICNRTIIYNINILKQFTTVNKDIGIFADGMVDIQVHKYVKNNYYSPFIGSIYYANIGISSRTSINDFYNSSNLLFHEYKKDLNLSEKDIAYLNFKIAKNNFFLNSSFKQFILLLNQYFKSIDYRYGIKGIGIRQFITDIWKYLNIIF